MKTYLIIEYFNPQKIKAMYRRLETMGRMLPADVRFIHSWIDERLMICYQFMESETVSGIENWTNQWRAYSQFKVLPVNGSLATKQKVFQGSLDEFSIQPLTGKLEPFLKRMGYVSIFVPEGGTPFPYSIMDTPDLAKYYLNWGKANDYGFIMVRSDVPVGAIWCRYFSTTTPGYGFVSEEIPEIGVAIEAPYRGRGLGQLLLSQLFYQLREDGIPAVSLSVHKLNPAFHWYVRNQFVVIREGQTAFTMLKTLH